MRIQNKIFLTFFLLATSVVLGLSIVYVHITTQEIHEKIQEHVYTAAYLRAQQVQAYLHTLTVRATDFSSDGKIRDSLMLLNSPSTTRDVELLLVDHLITNKLPVDTNLLATYVVAQDGRIVASSDPLDRDHVFFPKGMIPSFETPVVYALESDSSQQGAAILAVFAPIFVEEKYIGGIVNKVAATELYEVLTDRTGFSNTWESYLVNSDYHMVSPSRFLEDILFTLRVETENSRSCFTHLSNTLSERTAITDAFIDYRGVSVIGGYQYISDLDVCLLVEADIQDVFSTITRVQYLAIFLLFFAVVLIALLGWILGGYVSRPIKRLRDTMEHLGTHTDHTITPFDTKDEIGELSHAFVRLFNMLVQERKNVNKKIKEQTIQVEQGKKELEKTLKEMEFLNTSMVGRELKMIELKRRISALEEQKEKSSPLDETQANTYES